jgi:fatty acid desaturase
MTDNSDVYDPTAEKSAAKRPVLVDPAAPTNTYALVGFILSMLSFMTFVTAIPGVVLGHLGLKQIRQTGENGRGLAISAITVGWIVIGLGILTLLIIGLIILIPLLIVGAAINSGYSVS